MGQPSQFEAAGLGVFSLISIGLLPFTFCIFPETVLLMGYTKVVSGKMI
jgi:hypothetical protein